MRGHRLPEDARTRVETEADNGRPAKTHLPISRGWLRLEAALSSIWRWRGVLEGDLAEASRRLIST